jgi:hypothetical protein
VISQCLSEQLSCAEYDQDLLQQYYHCKIFDYLFSAVLKINIFSKEIFKTQKNEKEE